jgi:hypothetical protein
MSRPGVPPDRDRPAALKRTCRPAVERWCRAFLDITGHASVSDTQISCSASRRSSAHGGAPANVLTNPRHAPHPRLLDFTARMQRRPKICLRASGESGRKSLLHGGRAWVRSGVIGRGGAQVGPNQFLGSMGDIYPGAPPPQQAAPTARQQHPYTNIIPVLMSRIAPKVASCARGDVTPFAESAGSLYIIPPHRRLPYTEVNMKRFRHPTLCLILISLMICPPIPVGGRRAIPRGDVTPTDSSTDLICWA